MEQENKTNVQEFEINKLVVDTHNKIAKWHNDESSDSKSLKFLSLELVQEIAGSVFKHLGLEYSEGLKIDDETRKALKDNNLTLKTEKNSFSQNIARELSDEELIKEIEEDIK